MGFTIANYSLLGLQDIQNLYVTLRGQFTIQKNYALEPFYTLSYTIFFQSSPTNPIINQRLQTFDIQSLPKPLDLYNIIYEHIKVTLDPAYGTPEQTLVFTDDL